MRSALSLVVVGLLDLGAAVALWRAWSDLRSLDTLEPVLIQGPRMDGFPGSDLASEPATQTSLVPDELPEDGLLDLAWLVVPGYDPPEIRADPTPLELADFPLLARNLHGRQVRSHGHVIPLLLEKGRLHQFLLTRFPPGCCFGARPVLDEWIEVTVPDGVELSANPLLRVEAEGILEVGELLDSDGYALSLYRMTATRVAPVR